MMKKLNLLFVTAILILSNITLAQNPFASIGKKSKPMLSLSDGKYVEHFENDSVRQIGSAMVNIYTEQIVAFVNREEQAKKDIPKTNSRFLSIDPLARQFPFYTPYQYAGNKPINCIDIDGLEAVASISFGDLEYRSKNIKIVDSKAVIENISNSNSIGQFVEALKKASKTDYRGIGFVAVFGHGIPDKLYGEPSSGGGGLKSDDLSKLKTAIDNGEISFAENAVIYLGNCNAGTTNYNDKNFAQQLADITGASVIAGSAPKDEEAAHAGSVGVKSEKISQKELVYNMWMPKKGDFMMFKKGQNPTKMGDEINLYPMVKEAAAQRDNMEPIPFKPYSAPSQEPEIK